MKIAIEDHHALQQLAGAIMDCIEKDGATPDVALLEHAHRRLSVPDFDQIESIRLTDGACRYEIRFTDGTVLTARVDIDVDGRADGPVQTTTLLGLGMAWGRGE